MRRIWPPEAPADESVVRSDIPHLHDWCAYFEVNFRSEEEADRFVRNFGLRFPRAAGTVRGSTAWMTLRIGAADEQEVATLSALTVRIAADVKPVSPDPEGAVLHHVDPVEPGFAPLQETLRQERAELVRYAEALGIQRGLGAGEPGAGGSRRPAIEAGGSRRLRPA